MSALNDIVVKISFETNAGYVTVCCLIWEDPNTGGLYGDLNEEQKGLFAECRGSGNEIRMLKGKVRSSRITYCSATTKPLNFVSVSKVKFYRQIMHQSAGRSVVKR